MNFAPKKQNFKTLRTVLIWGGIIFIAAGIILWPSVARVQKDLHQLQKTPTEEAKREFDASLEATKALVGGIGTIATIAGGIFLYVNYKQAQDKLAHEKEKAKKDAELAESRLITERFSKAVEQLGSKEMEVRIGGIYALEQIAKDSGKYRNLDSYHWTVMEILTAFIRERSPVYPKQPNTNTALIVSENPQNNKGLSAVTGDIQAALAVIGRRTVSRDRLGQQLNFSCTNLTGADLQGAKLLRANFEKASLQNALLQNAKLQGANLRGANLQANLEGSNLQNAELSNAVLQNAYLQGAKLQSANLEKANLREAFLVEANLQKANLKKTNLQDARLYKANLKEVGLLRADLTRANLVEANMQEALLWGADLQNAVLLKANLKMAVLKEANFKGAELLGTNLQGATHWNEEQFQEAKLCGTILPNNTINHRDCQELGINIFEGQVSD